MGQRSRRAPRGPAPGPGRRGLRTPAGASAWPGGRDPRADAPGPAPGAGSPGAPGGVRPGGRARRRRRGAPGRSRPGLPGVPRGQRRRRRPGHPPGGRGRGARERDLAGGGRGPGGRGPGARPGRAGLPRRPRPVPPGAPAPERSPAGTAAVVLPRRGRRSTGIPEVATGETALGPLAPPPGSRGARSPEAGALRAPGGIARRRWIGRPGLRARGGGGGAGHRAPPDGRGGPRGALRGDGGRPPPARELRSGVRRPSRPARCSPPPPPLAPSALRPIRAIAPAAAALSWAGPLGGHGVPHLRPAPFRRPSGRGRGRPAPTLGRGQPGRPGRVRLRPLDDRASGLRGGGARGGRDGVRGATSPAPPQRRRRRGAPGRRGDPLRHPGLALGIRDLDGVVRAAAVGVRAVARPRARHREGAGGDRRPRRPGDGGRARPPGRRWSRSSRPASSGSVFR